MPGTDVQALAQQGKWTAFFQAFTADFGAVVPKHTNIEAFLGLAAAYVRRDRNLTQAAMKNPASLILALRECASLGHMPKPGVFSLVPFPDKKAVGGVSIVGVEEWRGVVERMFRAGGVTAVNVECGREKDPVLSFNRTRDKLPRHEYDEHASRAERGPLKAVYAWAELVFGGTSYVVWLNRHEVARHRAMSKSIKAEGGGNFWGPEWPAEGPNTESMWRKTSLHVLEGFVPTSAEYRWELARSQAGTESMPLRTEFAATDDTVDAEIVDEPASQEAVWDSEPVRQPPDTPPPGTKTGGQHK